MGRPMTLKIGLEAMGPGPRPGPGRPIPILNDADWLMKATSRCEIVSSNYVCWSGNGIAVVCCLSELDIYPLSGFLNIIKWIGIFSQHPFLACKLTHASIMNPRGAARSSVLQSCSIPTKTNVPLKDQYATARCSFYF